MGRWTGCGERGKIPMTKGDAERKVREWLAIERDSTNAQGLNAYRCRDCGRWHIGHSATKAGAHTGGSV